MGKYSLSVACLTWAMSACTPEYRVEDAGADAQADAYDATVDAPDAADAETDTPVDAPPPDALPDGGEAGPKDAGCPGARIECNGKCLDCPVGTSSDSQNRMAVCGADGGCATACKLTATLCTPAGDAGATATCVNLDSDPQACGACTQRCGNGSSVPGQCNAGKCAPMAITALSSDQSALVATSSKVLLFHKDNQVRKCTLPTCDDASQLTLSATYTVPPSPNGIAIAGSPVFYVANQPIDGGSVALIARCGAVGACAKPSQHLGRGALGLAGDPAGLYLTDGTGLLQQVDVGIADAATTLTTATSALLRPVLTSTHVYFYQEGSGIYRCPRTGACTPEKVVAITAIGNTPYDVVNDTLFYAENSAPDASPPGSRVMSCSVATTPASCDPTKVKQLASGLPPVAAVTADAKAVYFTNKGVSVCTDLVNGCTGAQLVGYVTADAEHSGSVRVVDEFVYWVQTNVDKSVNVMRVHVPY